MIITNLLQKNPSFETGDMTGWTTSGWVQDPKIQQFEAQYGTYEATLYPNPTGLNSLISASVTALAGARIVAVVRMIADTSMQSDTAPTLGISADGALISKPIAVVPNSWRTYTSMVTVPPNTKNMQLRLAFFNTGDSQFCRVDGAGLYTDADWQTLQKLGLDYFDGNSMPLAS